MAVMPMEQITLCAMRRDSKKILELLQRRGVVDVSDTGAEDEVFQKTDTVAVQGLLQRNAEIAEEALGILAKHVPKKGGGLAFLQGREAVDVKTNEAFEKLQDDTLRAANKVVRLQKNITEAKAEIIRAEAGKEALKPWMDLSVPQTFAGTKKTSVFIGSLEGDQPLDTILQKMAEAQPDLSPVHVEIISHSKFQTCLLVIAPNRFTAQTEDALRAVGFARPSSASAYTPKEQTARLDEVCTKAEETIKTATEKIIALDERREDFKYLQDNMTMRAERYDVVSKSMISKHAFVLSGYLPAEDSAKLKEELISKFDCDVQLQEAERPGDTVPVKLKNNWFSEPVEGIVESYGVPGKKDIDPSGVMSVFYYIMFGLMFGDAGYGLIIVAVCGYCLLKFKNMEPNWSKNIRMFFWCGACTMFWGIIYSSYFGDVVDVVSKTFFGTEVSIPPVWFYITDEPMLMLVFCLAIGIVHLSAGYIMRAIKNVKNGDPASVVYDTVFPLLIWYSLAVVFCGSDMFANLAGFRVTLPPIGTQICYVLAGIGALGTVLFGGRESKNWALRILQGVYALYNALSGWLSDTLSYARLLALGLASGVVGSVMNELGVMAGGGVVGAIVFIMIFAAGHGMNFGINVLGAYVHSNRLEYIEFFGKFYEGDGRKFKPFGMNTKYYKIVEEK